MTNHARFAPYPRSPVARSTGEFLLTLEQLAIASQVEPMWLRQQIDNGSFPGVKCVVDRLCISADTVQRARLMRQLEDDFDAVPAFNQQTDKALADT